MVLSSEKWKKYRLTFYMPDCALSSGVSGVIYMTPTTMRKKEPMVGLPDGATRPTSEEETTTGAGRARRLPRLAFTSDGWIDFKVMREINGCLLDGRSPKKGAGHGKNRKILNSTEG
jgi:hypothetical protein